MFRQYKIKMQNRQITKNSQVQVKKLVREDIFGRGGVSISQFQRRNNQIYLHSMFINRHLLFLHKSVKYRTPPGVLIKCLVLHAEYWCMHVCPTSELETSPPSPGQQDLKKHLFSLVEHYYTKMLNLSLSTKV